MTYFHINLNPRGKFKKNVLPPIVISLIMFLSLIQIFLLSLFINVYFMNGLTKTHFQGGGACVDRCEMESPTVPGLYSFLVAKATSCCHGQAIPVTSWTLAQTSSV